MVNFTVAISCDENDFEAEPLLFSLAGTAKFGHELSACASRIPTARFAIEDVAVGLPPRCTSLRCMTVIIAGLPIGMATVRVSAAGMGEGIAGNQNGDQQAAHQ